ncbi:hypothetical protein MTO96_021146 [Rhipicephalus appendiculatus]
MAVAGDSCHTCRNRVFLLERLMVDGRLYHRSCFRCSRCDAVLSPGAYNECDNAPGTYECTVCPKDEGPEFTLTRQDDAPPKTSTPKGSPAPVTAPTKPEIPEKKLELTESVRVARKLFQSAMVAADASPDATRANFSKVPETTNASVDSSPVVRNGDEGSGESRRQVEVHAEARVAGVPATSRRSADDNDDVNGAREHQAVLSGRRGEQQVLRLGQSSEHSPERREVPGGDVARFKRDAATRRRFDAAARQRRHDATSSSESDHREL